MRSCFLTLEIPSLFTYKPFSTGYLQTNSSLSSFSSHIVFEDVCLGILSNAFQEKKTVSLCKTLCSVMHHELPSDQAIWFIIRVTCCAAMGKSLPKSLAHMKAWEPGGTTQIPMRHNSPIQINVELT